MLEAFGDVGDVLQPGDVIVTIDGETAVDLLQETMSLVSSPTVQYKRVVALTRLLMGPVATEVSLVVAHADGNQETIQLRRSVNVYQIQPQNRPENFAEVAPDVFYFDLSTVGQETFHFELAELDNPRGLIFDMRGYPATTPQFMELLIEDTISTAQFLVPQINTPNQENVTFDDGSWTVEPRNEAPISSNIVFLTDGHAISYAETLMAMVATYRIGEIVGEPTAGTNGNVNRIELPSGHIVNWTGMLVLNQDGSQHHGIGVQPTVPVVQTLDDLRNGIDTQLQAAIQLTNEQQ